MEKIKTTDKCTGRKGQGVPINFMVTDLTFGKWKSNVAPAIERKGMYARGRNICKRHKQFKPFHRQGHANIQTLRVSTWELTIVWDICSCVLYILTDQQTEVFNGNTNKSSIPCILSIYKWYTNKVQNTDTWSSRFLN